MKLFRLVALTIGFISLGGCAAGSVAISKRNLEVSNRMSETVFLTPSLVKTVYVDVRNTSDKPNFNLGPQITTAVRSRGYEIVADPESAQYRLQANVLSVGQTSQTAAQAATTGGFGTPVDGAIAAWPPPPRSTETSAFAAWARSASRPVRLISSRVTWFATSTLWRSSTCRSPRSRSIRCR